MDLSFLSQINYIAVLVTSIVFFFLGSAWFSNLFGETWVEELKKHNVTIKQPTKNELMTKMLLTFGSNILASWAMACLVILTGSTTFISGLIIGKIAAIFAIITLSSVFVWENRSLKLFLIDVGYPVLGIIISAIILSLWH